MSAVEKAFEKMKLIKGVQMVRYGDCSQRISKIELSWYEMRAIPVGALIDEIFNPWAIITDKIIWQKFWEYMKHDNSYEDKAFVWFNKFGEFIAVPEGLTSREFASNILERL